MQNEQDTVNIKCANVKCDSKQATMIPRPSDSDRLYRCVKCGAIKAVSVGGHFPY